MIIDVNRNELLNRYLNLSVNEGLCKSKGELISYLDYLYQDLSSFVGKSILDVGGGCGLISIYAAIRGAKKVILLEPELAGSEGKASAVFKRIAGNLLLDDVTFQPVRFQDFDAGSQTFDVVLLHNSINHLDEKACVKLQYDYSARAKYRLIFRKLSSVSNRGAKLIIADCSSRNFFASLNIRNPFAPMIEWQKHQSPEYWGGMLLAHGFANPKIHWTMPNNLRSLDKLLGNFFITYFLTSHFVLTMDKA